jgi:hypothetical protein
VLSWETKSATVLSKEAVFNFFRCNEHTLKKTGCLVAIALVFNLGFITAQLKTAESPQELKYKQCNYVRGRFMDISTSCSHWIFVSRDQNFSFSNLEISDLG